MTSMLMMRPTTFEIRLRVVLFGPFGLLGLALLGAMLVGVVVERFV